VKNAPTVGATALDLKLPIDSALSVVLANIQTFGSDYPDDCTVDGFYRLRPPADGFALGANRGWTTGFWPGMLWLAWEFSSQPAYLKAGLAHLHDFARRIDRLEDVETHDLGFLYSLAAIAPWRLAGKGLPVGAVAEAERAGLAAANHLLTRWLEPAGILQAWGDLDDPAQRGRTIIDSLMNLPLLRWASTVSDQPAFAANTLRHAEQLRRYIVRPDSSTFHTFWWDPLTGAPIAGTTAQGHSDTSCWARGQAWGIYGFALAYRDSGDELMLETAERVADYFLAYLPSDHVPYWDLAFGDGSGQPRDSSAAAVAACGLFELASLESNAASTTPAANAARYRKAAYEIVGSLAANYAPKPDQSNALLLHGVYDMPKLVGVDEGCLWGDYFYLEALMRASNPSWNSYW
jgi:unsaturated chondroitin disaccharide hydrolase